MRSEQPTDQAWRRSVERLDLLDRPGDPAFNRLTGMAARLLRTPIAMATLIGAESQRLLGQTGLGEPWTTGREMPLSHSFCRHVAASGAPLMVADAREHPVLRDSPAIAELGMVAYAGLPLRLPDGQIIGALCAVDRRPRAWGEEDRELLGELACLAESELALRQESADHARAARYQIAQRSAFDQIAAGRPLDELLGTLAHGIESQIVGVCCAIMLLDDARLHLRTAAAPSLPPGYCRAIDGVRIGPQVGSCGTAAFLGKPVVVVDIAVDPLWAPWRDLAVGYGLRACWSIPIFDSAGRILGTFALYHSEPRRPSDVEFDMVLGAANLVAVAVERWRTIDALRASEARLRRSEANLAAVFEHTDDAIWSVDADLRVVTINGRAVAKLRLMTGASVAVGQIFDDGMGDGLRVFWRGLYRRALAGDRVATEFAYQDGDRRRWCEISLNPIHMDDAVSGVSVFTRETTERKQAEADRLEMERAWQETQRLESLGVLAGGIAHDFNNLLATILGNAELALLDTPASSAAGESLRQVELAAQRAAEMTQQILAYAGKGRVSVEPIGLNALVQEMASLLRGSLRQAPLDYRLEAGLPTIEGDPAQLRQVVMNLLVNAAEAIGGGPGAIVVSTGLRELDARATAGFEPDLSPGRYVALEVRDSGPGMSRATLARIFEPFFTTKFTGRGLGLAAVQGIVRGHCGGLRVESTPGVGTVFTVMLPALNSPLAAAGPGAATAPGLRLGQESGVILAIDDEAAVLQITAQMLRRLGYSVLEARSPGEGLALLEAAPAVRCVLLDWTMPGVGGGTALASLRSLRPQMPVIVMSGYSEHTIAEQVRLAGPVGFLHKPFSVEALQGAIVAAARGV